MSGLTFKYSGPREVRKIFRAYGTCYTLPVIARVWEWRGERGELWSLEDANGLIRCNGLVEASGVWVKDGATDAEVSDQIENALKSRAKKF